MSTWRGSAKGFGGREISRGLGKESRKWWQETGRSIPLKLVFDDRGRREVYKAYRGQYVAERIGQRPYGASNVILCKGLSWQ
jgi:hypothetical protein